MATTIDPDSFSEIEFDYLIAGGGTAGLTLAVRLSEDPDITVGVIEAGYAHFEADLPFLESTTESQDIVLK